MRPSRRDIDVIYELYGLDLGTSRVFHVFLLACFVSNNLNIMKLPPSKKKKRILGFGKSCADGMFFLCVCVIL